MLHALLPREKSIHNLIKPRRVSTQGKETPASVLPLLEQIKEIDYGCEWFFCWCGWYLVNRCGSGLPARKPTWHCNAAFIRRHAFSELMLRL